MCVYGVCPEEDVRSTGARVICGFVLPDVGAENQTQDLRKEQHVPLTNEPSLSSSTLK